MRLPAIALMLPLVFASVSCAVIPPQPIGEMTVAEFDVYLTDVQFETWDFTRNVWLPSHPESANDVDAIADVLMLATDHELGGAASSWMQAEAESRGIDPALSYGIRKIVQGIGRRTPAGGERGRWADVMGVVGAGLRLAVADFENSQAGE